MTDNEIIENYIQAYRAANGNAKRISMRKTRNGWWHIDTGGWYHTVRTPKLLEMTETLKSRPAPTRTGEQK